MSLLNDGKLAKTIAAALANVMYPIQLKRVVPGGGYDPSTGTVDPGSTTIYTARGMVDSFSPAEIQAGIVKSTDRKVTLLTEGLGITPTPETDKVTVEGADLTIVSVTSDPARATWTLQVR